ncbi:helix-turn-helix domain-containing protein [Brevundimonas vesicularis]|uniref:helix-turn-helix domain-containing protein n=1 Tax=Brevundimonas vesicularis TaxID=41276 RepID=UPI00082D2843|nr:short-chain fatty acyl-CoA regulator family protein [Brevundimonas vesicularis]
MAEKLFLGAKLRKLREARGWTLEACAERLGLSPSYLSQIETNQRPATARVLIALTRAFHVDASLFDLEGDARLIADLREATTDIAGQAEPPTAAELKQAVANTPRLARQFLALHQTFRRLDERVKALATTLVQDGQIERALEAALSQAHGVRVAYVAGQEALRRYDPASRVLTLDAWQPGATRSFQLAHQLALLSFRDLIEAELDQAAFRTDAARDVARVGLANYAAGALLLPYRAFLEAAREEKHDIDRLRTRFQVSFEQVCHRLSTLQRPGWRGVPFYFARVDMAGNITKRHSATRFQFARFGGACPLWNVHEAFAAPDRIGVQLAEMPDGSRYISIARSVSKPSGSYLANDRRYALSLGCEVEHAGALVYAAGLDLNGPAARIGVSCRICERTDCTQRAFPPLDRTLHVPENERGVVPYVLDGPRPDRY